nr:BREX-2 system phosphatase PglZ [Endozoicomonas sp.]
MYKRQDKAWQALAQGLLNYSSPSLDLPSLFQWSLVGGCDKAFSALPDEMKDQVGDWLKPGIPECEALVRKVWMQGQGDNLLAIGLACSVMYHPSLMGQSKSALKFRGNSADKIADEQNLIASRAIFNERYLGGSFADTKALKYFGEQALNFVELALVEQMTKGQQNSRLSQSFGKAEQMLASLDLATLTVLSDILPGGFRLRLDGMTVALEKAVKGQSLKSAKEWLQNLKDHRLARSQSANDQIMRAEMALRLCEWLQSDAGNEVNRDSLLSHYIDHGSFVDWARSKIWQGDVHEGLSHVYQSLSEKVGKRREQQNETFASVLPAIARGDKLTSGLLPVEQMLDQVVAPLAKSHHVLLLVLDGMSQAVYRELTVDLVQQNWIEWQKDTGHVPGLISVLPSITRASRCSLLSGELCDGVAADEKKAFTKHAALKAMASTRFPPKLYHKGDLQQSGSGALSGEVRSVLAGTEHRVAAVVVNAVDDQLSTNAQLSMDWKMDTIALLRQVMEAAREAGRVIIMTSDHGHVLDHDMKSQGKNDGGERFKPFDAGVKAGELLLTGSRVVTDNQQVILPWSEKIRYTSQKMGYHGGGSLQEVMIPLGIYVSGGVEQPPEGWSEVPRYQPEWWRTGVEAAIVDLADRAIEQTSKVEQFITKGKGKKAAAAAEVMDDMFAAPAEVASPLSVGSDSDWKSLLFESPVYVQARSRSGRTSIKDEQLLKLLQLLEVNGSQLMMGALVQSLGIPKLRMRGFLAGAQKLLNVDGYPVLSIDRTSDTVKLNIESLKTQFELAQ